jgi:endonuclease/exonuclease/phosphatase (EEP) superfamily protein YafD
MAGRPIASRHRHAERLPERTIRIVDALRLLLTLGIILGAGATAVGFLAPWFPELELINHFRPFILAATIPLLVGTACTGRRWLFGSAASLTALTLALVLLPVAYRAPPQPDGRADLKVVTLNLLVGNRDVESAARFLEGEQADVVLLQEADRLHAALFERLRGTYPHAYCPDRVCSLALLSRREWLDAGRQDVPPRRPLLIWARFSVRGKPVRVVGIHMPYPFEPQRQAQHTEWLIAHLRGQAEPLVLAGDLNLTPFSWKFTRLVHEVGLETHLLAGFSWPAHRYRPVVLLDHVLTTPGFATVAARVGPPVGSDHRPVIVELVAPP